MLPDRFRPVTATDHGESGYHDGEKADRPTDNPSGPPDDVRRAAELALTLPAAPMAVEDKMLLMADLQGTRKLAAKLAQAWLAEHPADDGESATPEWLLSLPGWEEDPTVRGRYRKTVSVYHGVVIFAKALWLDGKMIAGHPTRGNVRRLLAALDIPLKEPR